MPVVFFSRMLLALLGPPSPSEVVERMHWSAPASCPDQDEVRGRLGQLVDPSVESPAIRIDAVVQPDVEPDGALQLRVEVTGGSQQSLRSFVSADCDELASTAVLVAAIAIDPFGLAMPVDGESTDPDLEVEAVAEPVALPQPEPSPAVVPPRAARLSSTAPPAKPRAVPRAPAWAMQLTAGPQWTDRATPTAALRVLAARQWKLWAVRFGGEGWLPQRFASSTVGAPRAQAGVAVGRVVARFEGCALPGPVVFSVPLCLGLKGGAALARGYGVPGRQLRGSFASAAHANAGILWRPAAGNSGPGPLGLFVGVEGAVQLTRAQFHIGSQPPAYVGPALAVSLVAGVEIRLRAK